jgi:hypothetical protein
MQSHQYGEEADECYLCVHFSFSFQFIRAPIYLATAIVENKYRMLLSMVGIIFADEAEPGRHCSDQRIGTTTFSIIGGPTLRNCTIKTRR